MWNAEGSGSDDRQTRSFQFLRLMKQSPSFEIIRKYSCSYKTDYAILSRHEDLERERERESCSSFITPHQQSRHHSSVLKSNISEKNTMVWPRQKDARGENTKTN
jgi:hypothetical protein